MSASRLAITLIGCCSLFAAATTASGDILAEEFFTHPDGLLVGQIPSPGPGEAWVGHDDPADDPIVVSGGKAILTQMFGTGGREDASIPIGSQDPGALLFARFDFMLPSEANLTGDPMGLNRGSDPPTPLDDNGLYFAHFRSDEPTTQFRGRTGIIQPSGGGDFGLAINANSQNLGVGGIWATDLSFDTTYRAVVSWDGTTGESRLWLDPTDESSTSVSHTVEPAGQQMEAFALRQSNDYDGQQVIDNVVVATTFAEALAGSGVEGAPGDYNGDGVVDAVDYAVWRDNLGGDASALNGNGTGAATVVTADFELWHSNYGASAGNAQSSSATPEPSSAMVFIVAALFIASPDVRRMQVSLTSLL